MKFLLFNFAVIAALFVLFNPDRADLYALADRAYETVGMAREKTESVVAKVTPPMESKAGEPAPAAALPTAEPVPATVAPKPEREAAAPSPVKQVAAQRPVEAPAPAVVAASGKKLDPAVAQRRAEVLGLDAPAAGPAEEKLMSAEQRRRELFTLAEEMELFYVRRLSR